MEGVPEDLIKQYRLLQYFSGAAYDAKAMPKQDVVGEALLNNDPESPTSIRNILHSLMNNNKSVMNVVKIVTGNEECSVQYALAYIIGQLCGIEISESTSSVSEEDPKEMLRQLISTANDNVLGPARKLPHGMNCTGLVIYDVLFGGIERFVLVQGHLLTRVRPRDNPYSTRRRYPTDWLVFFKAITASTFLRWQPNYQRLTLSFLIQLSLILIYKDKRCIDLALKRIRWACCVSEWGDSHKCTPVDLLQEYSMVAQVKKVGRRNPIAFINLEAVRLHSNNQQRVWYQGARSTRL